MKAIRFMQKIHKKSFLLYTCLPVIVILFWLGLSGVGGPYFGRIDEVSSNDMTTFLPSNAESTQVNNELMKFRDTKTIPAVVVFESRSKLSVEQNQQVQHAISALKTTRLLVGPTSPAVISDDGKAAFVVVPLSSSAKFQDVIPKLQTAIENTHPSLVYNLTGPAVFAQDIAKAFAGIDGILLFAALGVVFLILFIVYRSPILPIVTLLGAMSALSVAILVVWYLAKAGVVQLNGQVQGILFILVIGAATDYSLLYIARYREELAHFEDKWMATKATWKASWEPIVAAGGTVTLGLLCLLVSNLGSNKALGPVGGIGILFAILAALTFLPAVLLVLGRRVFWPRSPKLREVGVLEYQSSHPVWNRVGRVVSRHPRRLWMGCTFLLIIACLFIPTLKADGIAQSDFVIGKSEARDGQALLNKHFPAGSGSPAYILVGQNEEMATVKLLDEDRGVDSVSIATSKDGAVAPIGKAADKIAETIRTQLGDERNAQLAQIDAKIRSSMSGVPETVINQTIAQTNARIPSVDQLFQKVYPFSSVVPQVVDKKVLLEATLHDPADSVAARQTIQRLRNVILSQHLRATVGGVSAVQLDTNIAAEHDLRLIIPLILLVTTAILMILLRAVIAPLILLCTTLLSFGATLGIAALSFNHIWNYPGADPSVVIYGFVFLVALGIDYNIFLMTRVREESIKSNIRSGTIKALVVTGGVISSAGIVLASTFAALYVIPILFLAQIAFIVAAGVLLDTLVVRSLIVPSLTLEINSFMWWPSKLSRRKEDE